MLFRIALALAGLAALAQQQNSDTVDLDAPVLQQHAANLYFQAPAISGDIVQRLKELGAYAIQQGISTEGIDYEILPGLPALPLDLSMPASLLRGLQRDTCSSDAIMIGNVTDQQSHFTSTRESVYTDYAFTVQKTLKGTPAKRIVLTRRGGAIKNIASGGPLTSFSLTDDSYPNLKPNTTYLLFLTRISATGAYTAPDPFVGTLVNDTNKRQWMFVPMTNSQFVLPELAESTFEANIAGWLNACH